MTFDYSPRHLADPDVRVGPPAGVAPATHLLVLVAMLVVACAGGALMVREAGWQRGPAGMMAGLGFIVASLIHIAVSRLSQPSARASVPSTPVRRKRTATERVDGAQPRSTAPTASEAHDGFRHVEPSDLALALLAEVNATGAVPKVVHVAPNGASNAETGGVRTETEFERVDRLVRRLADQVNHVQATRVAAQPVAEPVPRLAEPAPPIVEQAAELRRQAAWPALDPEPIAGTDASDLAASIAALRHAAVELPPTEPDLAPVNQPSLYQPVIELAAGWPALDPSAESASVDAVTRPNPRSVEIIAALNAQRIDVALEPILDLQGHRPQHYEVSISVRAPGGQQIDLANVATDLSGTGVLPLLDTVRLTRATEMARKLAERGKTGAVFADLTGETLDDDAFQDTFAGNDREVGAFPGQLVLALAQSHVHMFTTADWQTLVRLRAAGFGFALTDVTGLDMDFEALVAAGFSFARLDAPVFLDGLPMADMAVTPPDICRHLAGCGLSLIVGGIRDEHQLARIFGFGVLLGQGQLFGGPRSVKAVSSTHAPSYGAVAAE